jgi:hypothetical protein
MKCAGRCVSSIENKSDKDDNDYVFLNLEALAHDLSCSIENGLYLYLIVVPN